MVNVTDDDEAAVSDVVVITATNVAPTAVLSGAASTPEGGPYSLTIGPGVDPGADTVTEYRVQWGDGTPVQVVSPAALGAAGRTLTHTYEDGTAARTITLDLVDEDGTHLGAGSRAVIVQNVAPVLTGLSRSATTIDENGSLTLEGTFSDPGTLDPHTVRISWGDGTAEETLTLAAGVGSFSAAHLYQDDRPSGADEYTISVRVNDGVVDSGPQATTIAVANVAPTFAALSLSATSAIEGTTLTLTGDVNDVGTLDAHAVSVDWGDGTPLQAAVLGAGDLFNLTHVFNVPGSYQVVTTATDDDGGLVRDTRTVVIADLAPVIAPGSLGTVSEGGVLTRTGSFSDASGPEDTATATVRYDGGPALPLTLGPDGTFTLQTVFAHDSPHTVTVTVTDRFGQTDTETFAVEVTNVAPVVAAGPDLTVAVGAPFTRTITFADPGADTWTAVVDYGDGTQQTLGPLTAREFAITHSYATRAVRTVTVTVNDGAASGVDQFVVSPPNVAPVLGALAAQTVVLTQTLQRTAAATDVDAPPQALSFSLVPGAPAGATIDPVTGVVRWTPGPAVPLGPRAVTVRVTDSGEPALFDEETFTVTVLPNLDVDGNGSAGAVDGQIIVRYLSGTPNAQLLTGVTLGPGATRTTAAAIRSYLDTGKALAPRLLDADGNGQITLLTDGRLISRYLAGATGAALIGGSAVGAGATRTTAAAIAAYLDGFRPVSLAPQDAALMIGPETASVSTSPVLSVVSAPAPPLTLAPVSPSLDPATKPQPLATTDVLKVEATPAPQSLAASRSERDVDTGVVRLAPVLLAVAEIEPGRSPEVPV